MKKIKIVFWVAALVLIGVFSVLLSGVTEDMFILPVVKFFWLLKGYYGSLDQVITWGALVFVLTALAVFSLRGGTLGLSARRGQVDELPGEVSQLAFWIRRARHGPYPRWYLARALAELALDLLRGRGADAERGGQLNGPGWEPPGETQAYIETAMRTTPATFSRQIEAAKVGSDPDPESVVEYLESYAEALND